MISYYDLLTMIKNGNVPQKIKYKGDVYEWYGDCYAHKSEDGIAYLRTCFLEWYMFDKCIEIIEENKNIEEIHLSVDDRIKYFEDNSIHHFNTNKKDLFYVKKLNELIKAVNELKKVANK